MIELYGIGSPNVHKVIIALEELDLRYELQQIDCPMGEQYSPEFTALNPNQKVPVIVDPDGPGGEPITLWESGAILIYLADKSCKLLSTHLATRYQTIKWLMFQMASVGPMFGQLAHFRVYAKGEEHAYSRARYATEVKRIYDVVETRLAEAPYLGGDDYSIADIACWPWMFNTTRRCIDKETVPNVARWIKAVGDRPAVIRSMEVMQSMAGRDLDQFAVDHPKELDRYLGRGEFSRASPEAMQV
jgi:GST-like protein